MPPRVSKSVEFQSNHRKRVCRACNRCRLKKAKCDDGDGPCKRCKTDNAICVFGEHKKSQNKVYPKGYVEMLEQQQSQLVAGLRELYSRLQKGEGWLGPPLKETSGGYPLTHDILNRLELLNCTSDGVVDYEAFEEDRIRIQQKLHDRGAACIKRRDLINASSNHGHNSSSSSSSSESIQTQQTVATDNSFARNAAPPTPQNSSSPRRSQSICPVEEWLGVSSALMFPGDLGSTKSQPMTIDVSADTNEPMYGFESFKSYDQDMMTGILGFHNLGPMMPAWASGMDVDFDTVVQDFLTP